MWTEANDARTQRVGAYVSKRPKRSRLGTLLVCFSGPDLCGSALSIRHWARQWALCLLGTEQSRLLRRATWSVMCTGSRADSWEGRDTHQHVYQVAATEEGRKGGRGCGPWANTSLSSFIVTLGRTLCRNFFLAICPTGFKPCRCIISSSTLGTDHGL